MFIAEKDAGTKWCPMVRALDGADVGGSFAASSNIGGARPATFNCIGSRCAMWRWRDRRDPMEDDGDRFGYCGLAGRPEYLIQTGKHTER